MKKTVGKQAVLLLLFAALSISMGYSQQKTFVCKGVVTDSITGAPLGNVRIYRMYPGDTLQLVSDAVGKFQVSVASGAKLQFRKAGYAWQNVKIIDTKQQRIELVRSRPRSKENIGEENYADTEIYYDGEVVPQAEWDDATSTFKDEIQSLEVISSKITKGKNKVIFKTKP